MTRSCRPTTVRRLTARIARAVEPYLYSAPALILIVAVMLVPLILGISYAFRDIQLLNPFSGGFIGLDHFRELAQDKAFFRALKNTLWWTGASVFLQFVFGLILALLLDKPFCGRGLVQALVFLPWAVPTFLAGLNWAWLFNPSSAPFPHWLFALGIHERPEQHPLRSATSPCGGPSSPMSGGAFPSSPSPFWPHFNRSRATSMRPPRSTAPSRRSVSCRSRCRSSPRPSPSPSSCAPSGSPILPTSSSS